MKKYIKIEAEHVDISKKNSDMMVWIVEQSHKGQQFGENIKDDGTQEDGFSFSTKIDGKMFALTSCLYPAEGNPNSFCMRGTIATRDHDIITIPYAKYLKVLEAIAAYNEHEFSGEILPWGIIEHRFIRYYSKRIDSETVSVKITEQTHRGKKFGERDQLFKWKVDGTEYKMYSLADPENRITSEKGVYVRGSTTGHDNRAMTMTNREYYIFANLVEAYNQYKFTVRPKEEEKEKTPPTPKTEIEKAANSYLIFVGGNVVEIVHNDKTYEYAINRAKARAEEFDGKKVTMATVTEIRSFKTSKVVEVKEVE